MSSPTIVQLVHIDQTGDSLHRMAWPAQELARQKPWRIINLDARSQLRHNWALEADLLVIYQSHDPEIFPILRKRHSLGRPTLVEYNDNFYHTPSWAPVAKEWNNPLIWHQYEKFIDLADGLIVTGPGLHALFESKFPSKAIHVLLNHLSQVPILAALTTPAQIKMGWAGSLGHIGDLISAMPTFLETLNSEPKLHLCLMGNEAIPTLFDLPKGRTSFSHWGSLAHYFSFLMQLQIGVIPLLETPYNLCRSDIKAVEMAGHGVLPIVPRFAAFSSGPYAEFVKATECPTYTSLTQLKEVVCSLLKDNATLLELREKARLYVAGTRIHSLRHERAELYERYLETNTSPSNFLWPLEAGFHEVIQDISSKSIRPTPEIAALAKQGDRKKALELTGVALEQNVDDVDLQLIKLELLAKGPASLFRQHLQHCLAAHADDLRFLLSAINNIKEERANLWRQLVEKCISLSSSELDFYELQIAKSAAASLQGTPPLAKSLEALLNYFPHNSMLRLSLAGACIKSGLYEQAGEHYRALARQKRAALSDKNQIDQIELGYLEAWGSLL